MINTTHFGLNKWLADALQDVCTRYGIKNAEHVTGQWHSLAVFWHADKLHTVNISEDYGNTNTFTIRVNKKERVVSGSEKLITDILIHEIEAQIDISNAVLMTSLGHD